MPEITIYNLMIHILAGIRNKDENLINAKDGHNRTPLHLCASNGNDVIFWHLLSHGASIEAKDEQGATALHRSVDAGNNEICRLLLDRSISNIESTK